MIFYLTGLWKQACFRKVLGLFGGSALLWIEPSTLRVRFIIAAVFDGSDALTDE